MEKKAPLVIGSECQKLNKILQDKKSTMLIVDYKLEEYNMETIKLMYNHIDELGLLLEYIRDKKVCRIINFNLSTKKRRKDIEQYNIEAQIFNILRAFLSGLYSSQPMFFPEKAMLLYKMNRVYKEKIVQPDKDLFYFSKKKLYKEKLKRYDSYHKEHYETSRHLLIFNDYEIEKNKNYLQSIQNPIVIKPTGKVSNENFLQIMNQLQLNDKTIIILLSFYRKKKIYSLLKSLRGNENLLFLCHISKNFDMEKQTIFFDQLLEKYHIQNSGFYIDFTIKNNIIC